MEAGRLGSYNGEISLPPKASTRTKLHELGHKKFGHEPGRMSAARFVDKEIDAEVYAWEMMDKKPNHRVGIPALTELIVTHDFLPEIALRLVVNRLELNGIRVTQSGVEDLRRLVERIWV